MKMHISHKICYKLKDQLRSQKFISMSNSLGSYGQLSSLFKCKGPVTFPVIFPFFDLQSLSWWEINLKVYPNSPLLRC